MKVGTARALNKAQEYDKEKAPVDTRTATFKRITIMVELLMSIQSHGVVFCGGATSLLLCTMQISHTTSEGGNQLFLDQVSTPHRCAVISRVCSK